MSKRLTRLLTVSLFQPTVVRNGKKSKSRVWWAAWRDVNGKLQRRSTRTTNKTAAKHLAAQLQEQLQLGKVGLVDSFAEHLAKPWDEFVHEFMTVKASRMPAASEYAYRMCLGAFTRTAKPGKLGDVTVQLLDEYVTKRLADGVAGATVNKELRHLRAVLRWARFRRYVPDQIEFTGLFVRVDQTQPVVIAEADFVAMAAALKKDELKLRKRPKDWWRLFLYLAYYLGMRRGELLGLTWDSVNLDTQEVLVKADTSKGRKDRPVPMPAELAALLREWKDTSKPQDAQAKVLPWPYPTCRQLYLDWHRIQKAAGIADDDHYVPKNCRSSCASELIAAGVPTVTVKDYLGHASVTTTERYYINTQPALRSAANARKVRLDEA